MTQFAIDRTKPPSSDQHPTVRLPDRPSSTLFPGWGPKF